MKNSARFIRRSDPCGIDERMTPTVIVVGSINVDLCAFVERLPAPGETVMGGTFVREQGGKGANQAVAAARLGARVVLVGMVGRDDMGDAARANLTEEGVDVTEVGAGEGHTGVAEILIDSRGENLIAVASGANNELTAPRVTESLGRIDARDAVVTSVLEVPVPAVTAAATVARERGWRLILNPAPAKPIPDELLSLCDVLTPNQHEVGGLGKQSPEELLAAGVSSVVVTLGADGAELLRPGLPPHHQPAFGVQASDTTGAGDAFTGALAWALASGSDLEAGLRAAGACAALSTRAHGARGGMPTRKELDDFLETASKER
jgi:ribokinase